jgi:hypothetical protein
MDLLKSLNIGVRFLLELCLVASMFYVGFHIPTSAIWRWVAAIGFSVLTVAVWGYFIAPKAEHLLDQPYRLVVELVLFGLAVVGLGLVGQLRLALVFASIVALNEILLIVWKQ